MLQYKFERLNHTILKNYCTITFNPPWDTLESMDSGSMQSSEYVSRMLSEIQKVLNGQKAIHNFGGSDALLLRVTASDTEFVNLLTDENYGKVPTLEVVKLLTDWRDFLISKGK